MSFTFSYQESTLAEEIRMAANLGIFGTYTNVINAPMQELQPAAINDYVPIPEISLQIGDRYTTSIISYQKNYARGVATTISGTGEIKGQSQNEFKHENCTTFGIGCQLGWTNDNIIAYEKQGGGLQALVTSKGKEAARAVSEQLKKIFFQGDSTKGTLLSQKEGILNSSEIEDKTIDGIITSGTFDTIVGKIVDVAMQLTNKAKSAEFKPDTLILPATLEGVIANKAHAYSLNSSIQNEIRRRLGSPDFTIYYDYFLDTPNVGVMYKKSNMVFDFASTNLYNVYPEGIIKNKHDYEMAVAMNVSGLILKNSDAVYNLINL